MANSDRRCFTVVLVRVGRVTRQAVPWPALTGGLRSRRVYDGDVAIGWPGDDRPRRSATASAPLATVHGGAGGGTRLHPSTADARGNHQQSHNEHERTGCHPADRSPLQRRAVRHTQDRADVNQVSPLQQPQQAEEHQRNAEQDPRDGPEGHDPTSRLTPNVSRPVRSQLPPSVTRKDFLASPGPSPSLSRTFARAP